MCYTRVNIGTANVLESVTSLTAIDNGPEHKRW